MLPPLTGRIGTAMAPLRDWLARRDSATSATDARLIRYPFAIAVIAITCIIAVVQHRAGAVPLGVAFDPTLQPVAAADYLERNPPSGNGFNELGWGGYLLHRLWPGQRVFIDGQTDFYGEALAREYLQVIELREGWAEVLDRHRVDWVILGASSTVVRQLAASGWITVHQDSLAAVLVRPPRPGS
jgi:hypothetical protein